MAWVRWGSVFMFLAVVMGAFGAHLLKGELDPALMEVYQTAVFWHVAHALALFGVAWLDLHLADVKIPWTGFLFSAGIVLFSGSLYVLSLTGMRWLGMVTPVGGLCFLAGWVIMALVK
ncbi:MAG: DUF423 domain-containing protein [Candidatus Omnitrophica bacterium]|nr:DUF423 domain-containing protein [Candidatus Omnitrophota bacterium]